MILADVPLARPWPLYNTDGGKEVFKMRAADTAPNSVLDFKYIAGAGLGVVFSNTGSDEAVCAVAGSCTLDEGV